jgi:hypothetical protein
MFSTYVFKHFFKSYHNIITIHEKITSQVENIIIVGTRLLHRCYGTSFIYYYSCNVGVFWEDVDLDLDYGFPSNLSQNVLTSFH